MSRVMDHLADQDDDPIGSNPLTWGFPRVGAKGSPWPKTTKIISGNGRPRQ